ncbi:MAG TPA: UDP-N-acetylmuramate--L-alanine ligase [Candidatus Polarisedimenticolia bacterium]|nr:UDP-N-acetylmuramate--L-alanine ligase [Candidatus Polarisedimenticolia bacterium]
MKKVRQVHFVGIGGIGMSGIAEVLLNLGYRVTGSDLAASGVTRRLEELGGKVTLGHSASNVEGADVVVVSSAVRPTNEEVVEARRRQIPVIPRAEMLAELMRMKYGVAIAGSHGKTSTTSMVAQVLAGTGLDPTIVIGGRLGILGSNAKLGKGDLLVAEADESDGSFLHLSPTIAVVTNIDAEHLDHYGSLSRLQDAFVDFLNKVPFYGTGIVCLDDPGVRSILPRLERRVFTYGLAEGADLTADRIELKEFTARFEAFRRGKSLGPLTLAVPGRHSISNGLAAIAVGLELEVPFGAIASHLSSFRGADRRFQLKGEVKGILVIDDYGHHPVEIQATLQAARRGWDRRTIVVFQPHRYSRVKALAKEFAGSFELADVVVVTEIYPAGEDPIPGVSGDGLATAIRDRGHPDVIFVPDLKDVPDILFSSVRPGDMVITLGAGSVWKAGEEFLRRMGAAS